MIIDDGRVVTDCTPQELEAESQYHHAVTVELEVSESLQAKFLAIAGVDRVESDEAGKRLTIFPENGQSIVKSVNDLIHAEDLSIGGLHVERGRLDDVFRSITTGGL
jgi:ABC-2 type transport system ATP-binding protein